MTTKTDLGFMKALIAEDDTILGFISFGKHAGEVMSAVQLVMLAKQPYTTIVGAMLLTLAEGLQMLFGSDAFDLPAH